MPENRCHLMAQSTRPAAHAGDRCNEDRDADSRITRKAAPEGRLRHACRAPRACTVCRMSPGQQGVFAQLTPDTARLLLEADTALSADRWAIINNGSPSARHRLYDAAALRHTCSLLRSIARAALDEDKLAVRILGRAHVEAWLTGIYLHFGGNAAIQRVAADTLNETELTDAAIKRHDKELKEAKSRARRRARKTRADNAGKAQWNAQHPREPPKPFLEEPYVPQQPEAGIDLSTRIADFTGIQAQALSLSEAADALTKLGPEHGFARENFTHIYLYYRLMSAVSVHPTLHLYDSYFEPPRGHFIHTAEEPVGDSVILHTWTTALYATALHVGWVLHDASQPHPVADELRTRLEPDPASTKGWAPGSQRQA